MIFQRNSVLAVLIAVLFLSTFGIAGETTEKESITWVKYDEGLKIAAKVDKLIFIDFYTDWCKFCHKMDRETFSDKEIITYFNEHYIGVKVNAESKKKMKLPEGEFSGRELSRQYGVRGYPAYWFLKPDGEKITNLSGYSPPAKFMPILQFVGGKHFENMTFQEYMAKKAKDE